MHIHVCMYVSVMYVSIMSVSIMYVSIMSVSVMYVPVMSVYVKSCEYVTALHTVVQCSSLQE